MPMIDVYVAAPGPAHMNNTGAYVHRMPASTVHTAGIAGTAFGREEFASLLR